jgi:murein DD-endopeptidase MepM/ murein hydrolase activator NlpD
MITIPRPPICAALALLGATSASAQSSSAGAPSVTWLPANPTRGSLVQIVVRDSTSGGAPDAIVAVRGTLADEPLHFERASAAGGAARLRAVGGIPVSAFDSIALPLVIERAGGRTDSLTLQIPLPPRPPEPDSARPPGERLRVAEQFGREPDSALAQRIAREGELALAAARRSHQTPRLWRRAFVRPRESRITSGFAAGREFNGAVRTVHMGVDFAGRKGAPVRAANRGVVALVAAFYLGGNVVYIDHGGGLVTGYLHLSRTRVAQGDTVARGQVIGLVGNSGNSTEPHLHFHIADANSPLGSEGVPYVHESFDVVGRCRGLFTECARLATPEHHRRETPAANMIIRFPQ